MNPTLETVKQLRAKGDTWEQIADQFDTTVPSLQKRFGKYRKELQPAVVQECRQCGKVFCPKNGGVFCSRPCYSKWKRIQQGGRV